MKLVFIIGSKENEILEDSNVLSVCSLIPDETRCLVYSDDEFLRADNSGDTRS